VPKIFFHFEFVLPYEVHTTKGVYTTSRDDKKNSTLLMILNGKTTKRKNQKITTQTARRSDFELHTRAHQNLFFEFALRRRPVCDVLPKMTVVLPFLLRCRLLTGTPQRFSSSFKHACHECFCGVRERCLCNKETFPEVTR
jgi:hypothetical protein